MIQGAIFVLKLLGILLLAVLLLLLIAVLCALFVPVRYRIRGELPEGGAGAFGEGKISWLFGMLSVRGRFEREGGLRLRASLLGFTLWRREEDSGEDDVRPPESGEDVQPDGYRTDAKAGDRSTGESRSSQGQEADTPSLDSDPAGHGSEMDAVQEEAQEEEKEAPASGLFERAKRRVRNFFEKIYRALRKLAFSFLAFCGKLKETAHKAEKAKKWFSDEKNQESLQLLLRQARRLAAHGLPRRGSGEITFGFEDPGLTGQVLAAASLVYPFCHRQLKLYPVFDRRILEGQFDFRGRIRSAYVLWLAWEIYRDKHTWRMIRRWLRRG